MGSELSVCTSERKQWEESTRKKNKEKYHNDSSSHRSDNRNLRPNEMTSYAQMSSQNNHRPKKTTRTYISKETLQLNNQSEQDIYNRVEEERENYRLSVGRAHTEEEGDMVRIHVERAKITFCERLENLRQEAAAKCMFATAQTIKEEISKVYERENSPTKQSSFSSPESIPTIPSIEKIENRNFENNNDTTTQTQIDISSSSSSSSSPSRTPITPITLTNIIPTYEDEMNEEERRRKDVFVKEMQQRIVEKQESRTMLSLLLAKNTSSSSTTATNGVTNQKTTFTNRLASPNATFNSSPTTTSAPSTGSSQLLSDLLQRVANK